MFCYLWADSYLIVRMAGCASYRRSLAIGKCKWECFVRKPILSSARKLIMGYVYVDFCFEWKFLWNHGNWSCVLSQNTVILYPMHCASFARWCCDFISRLNLLLAPKWSIHATTPPFPFKAQCMYHVFCRNRIFIN